MFFKKEKEFQYHPAVIKMLEDVVGGGTIVRADLRTAIFDGHWTNCRHIVLSAKMKMEDIV